jgi:hypothetical protein
VREGEMDARSCRRANGEQISLGLTHHPVSVPLGAADNPRHVRVVQTTVQ